MNKTIMMLLVLNALCIGTVLCPCIYAHIHSFDEIYQIDTMTFYEGDCTPYIHDIFLFGKVSNVRMGGYTPAYWFHIDIVIIIGKLELKVQWLEDCNGHMLSMDFRGFVLKNLLIGKISELLIY